MKAVVLPLSPKEQRILDLYDEGLSYKEIAARVGISINTLKSHARAIIWKSFAGSLRQAAYLRRRSSQ